MHTDPEECVKWQKISLPQALWGPWPDLGRRKKQKHSKGGSRVAGEPLKNLSGIFKLIKMKSHTKQF